MNFHSPGSDRKIIGELQDPCSLFFAHSPDFLFFKDHQDRWREANLAALALFGLEGVDFRGKTNRELGCWAPFSIESFERDESFDSLAWQTGKTVHVEESFPLKSGGEVVLDILKIPIFNPDGTRHCLLSVGRDITSRKRAEREMHRSQERLKHRCRSLSEELETANANLRALGDQLPDVAIYQYERRGNESGHYSSVSLGIERLFGISLADLSKEKGEVSQMMHPEDRPRSEAALKKSAEELSLYDFEGRIFPPSGGMKWLRWRATPRILPSGGVLWEGFITDDTNRKLAEVALQDALQALKVIKECGESIARAETEAELLQNVCDTILRIDGVRLAWIGYPQHGEAKEIQMVAVAGGDPESIEHSSLTRAEATRDMGPVGTAIRGARVVIIEDLENDPRCEPWREEALKGGLAKVVSLPLVAEKSCIGALTIYLSQTAAISAERVELLTQLANDISHGILTRRSQAERAQLEKELLKISEQEKQLIAQELHDGVCQQLAGAAMMGCLLQRRLAAENHPQADYANEVCKILAAALADARDLSHGLHPIKSTSGGLLEALAQLGQKATRLFNIPCSLDYDESANVEDPAAVTQLFRIAQEALTNAMKHGRATQVQLALRRVAEGILLSIQDNGRGFEKSSDNIGLGLQIMNHRAQSIGATFEIQSMEGTGTLVRCHLPWSDS